MITIKKQDIVNENRLLIIDDDIGVRDFIADLAEESGYETEQTCNADEFIQACDSFNPTHIFIDLVMPETDGIQLLRLLAERGSKAKICVMSGMDKKVLQTSQKLGEQLGLHMFASISNPASVESLEALFLRAKHVRTVHTEKELRQALDEQQLVLHYQPKLSHTSEKISKVTGVEALIRWQHPQLGLIYPDAFIGLAEQSGLITRITETVVRLAVSQASEWHNQGLMLTVAINISPRNLIDLDMPDKFAAILEEAGVEPAYFILEITETAAMAHVNDSADILTRFRLKNFSLSLDDFGTGYSSLKQLYQLPFSELKLDRSFVSEVDNSEEARIIVKSLIELAKNLGLKTCAEGVENQAILAFCQQLGCDNVQGYYISKPLTAGEVTKFVQEFRLP